MDPIAIVMMIIAIAIVWGGMVAAFVHLLRHPDEKSGDLAEVEGTGEGRVIYSTSTPESD